MTEAAPPQAIEVGWVTAGPLSPADHKAIIRARELALDLMRKTFPAFDWRMPLVHRREVEVSHRIAPVTLLDAGVIERDSANWDYALLVTEADLKGRARQFVLGTPSQAIGVAVASTARLDPAAKGIEASEKARAKIIAERLVVVFAHLFGHLNDLSHDKEPESFMFDLQGVADLEKMSVWSETSKERMLAALVRVADERLEETGQYRGHAVTFAIRAALREWRTILNATIEIRPWLFPVLLSRLTTAAASALLLLINTAEAWDLGMSQSPRGVAILSLVTLTLTSTYLLVRQRLLTRKGKRKLTERRVIAATSIAMAMVIGMATTYALLFAATLALSKTIFSPDLIAGWAASVKGPITFDHHLVLSAFVASLGLVIAALGASFESQDYFRHVALIDEET